MSIGDFLACLLSLTNIAITVTVLIILVKIIRKFKPVQWVCDVIKKILTNVF